MTPSRSTGFRVVVALGAVSAATGVMALANVDHTVAALVYVVVVVGASFLGPAPAFATVAAAFAGENYFFTPPVGTWRIANADDVTALVVFGIAATVVSVVVTRANDLRQRARVRELEARARLGLVEQLLGGTASDVVVQAAEGTLVRLFGLARCRIDVPTGRAEIVEGRRALGSDERELIHAFALGITTSVDRVRFDREATEAKVDASSQQSRVAFLSAMTHNLRTPLATIKAAVSALRARGDLDASSREDLLATAQHEVERLERLVSKVLHLSRIRSGTLDVRREPTDLSEVVASAVNSVWGLATERGVLVVRSGGEAEVVAVDPMLIEVATASLVENALRFAPAGSSVAVSSGIRDGRGEVRVVDHGPGVPPSERATVFDEFVRGEGVRDATGAGIGLTIARAFVEAHDGSLTIEDTPGGGATFVLTVPA